MKTTEHHPRDDERPYVEVSLMRVSYMLASALLLVALIASLGLSAPIDLSGQYTLNTILIPVSATVVGGTWIGTPAQFITPRISMESTLDLTLTAHNTQWHVNSAMNFAGFERFVIDAKLPLGPLLIEPEIWCAVPFETVIDDDCIANALVIPPGEMLFVKSRWTTTFELHGLRFISLLMIEDITFPNPNEDFPDPNYNTQTQSFHVGSITTITAEPYPGVLLTSVTSVCADSGSNDIVGWSAPGCVSKTSSLCDTLCFNETLSLSGLKLCGIPVWLNLAVDPCNAPLLTLTGGGSFSGIGNLELSGGFSLFPLAFSGFSFSGSLCDMIRLSVTLSENLEFTSASFSSSSSFTFGDFAATVSGSGSYTSAMGFAGGTFSASLRHSMFSGGMTIGVVNQSGNLQVASVSPRLQFTASPVSFSVSLMFSRTKLTRAMLTVGVIF